jgi:hypothetical protein
MDRSSPVASVTGTLVYLLFGPLLWAAHLTIIYGASTLICAMGEGDPAAARDVGVVILVATAVALAVISFTAAYPRPARTLLKVRSNSASTAAFLDRAMQTLAVLSFIGIAWAGATVVMITPCGQLR